MNPVTKVRRLAAIATVAFVALSGPVAAQDVSETHLEAARAAISAMRATEQFDAILPQAARALKNELIQKNPDLQALIIETVDGKAIDLASRRADLEREAALAYARVFTEEDLKAISEFYATPTGQKLISDGPIVAREVIEAAEIWQRGVARDLAQQVGEQLSGAGTAVTPQATPGVTVAPQEGGATETAPAPEGEAAPEGGADQ